jgi:hypothetical protein
MHEIICPHCNKAFKIDEAGYANILKQARDGDFDKQLHERLELAEREKQGAIAWQRPRSPMRCKALRPAKIPRFRPCRPSSLPLRWPTSRR